MSLDVNDNNNNNERVNVTELDSQYAESNSKLSIIHYGDVLY